MRRVWHRWNDRFAHLPRERRLLLAIAAWLLVSLPLLSYVVIPDWQQQRQVTLQVATTEQQIEQLEQSIQGFQQRLATDVNKPVLAQLERKKRQLQQLQQVSQRYSLLDVAERRAFFDAALSYPDSLELVTLASESPTNMTKDGAIKLYRHTIKARYQGSFDDLRRFFAHLRKQHAAVQWQQFEYQVTDYPTAQVSIWWTLLSTDKEVIGG